MTDLAGRVDGRLTAGWELLNPDPGAPGARLAVCCGHATGGWRLCTPCCAWLTCDGCFDEHLPIAHPCSRCDVCGVEVGTDARPAFTPFTTVPLAMTVAMPDGWPATSTAPVTFALSGVVCRQDGCVRALAGGYAAAAAVPAEPGSVASMIRLLEEGLAGSLYAGLPPAA